MNGKPPSTSGLIAAERRRMIYNLALEDGSVKITSLTKMLGVGPDTIRRDLDELDKEGKLIRSHGGAIAKDAGTVRLPYSQVRGENMAEKAWIGAAALAYLPATGMVFLGAGSTVYQLAIRMPEDHPVSVITSSPETGLYIATTKHIRTGLLGGQIRMDSYATDGGLSDEATDMLFYDIVFTGLAGIDIQQGITSIDRTAALFERKIIEHSSKVVALCDSSKFGRLSYAKIGPIDLLDVLITDQGVNPEMVEEIESQGIEVVVVGSGAD